jgi:hypothetical protein
MINRIPPVRRVSGTATYPTVVLGAAAARYLGVADVRLGQQVATTITP